MQNFLGTRIKQLRTENNLTQKEFASVIKIQNTTLSQYENGISTPNDDMKITIADYFDVSVDYLLGRTDQRKPSEMRIALNAISTDGLDDDDIEMIRGLVEKLKKNKLTP